MTYDDARAAENRRQFDRRRWISPLLVGFFGSFATAVEAAENGDWILQIEPTHMEAFGHDQQVLRIRELDLDATPAADRGAPVSLDTESRVTNRFRLEYRRATWQEWTVGLDFIFFGASQGRPVRAGAAGGSIDRTVFEVADRSFTSNGPSEPLYFRVLGDTDLEVWTMDAYGVRTLAETPQRKLGLVLGVRNADFDNDFHAFAGIGSAGGSLVEAGSNYERMLGPLVGVVAEMQLGKNQLIAHLSQAVVFGSADLGRSISDFTGPAPELAIEVVPQAFETYERTQDVTIPITDLRITWLHPLGARVSLGVTANASVWSDVPVPPDIVPGAGFGGGFNKNTVVFLGVGAAIQFRF